MRILEFNIAIGVRLITIGPVLLLILGWSSLGLSYFSKEISYEDYTYRVHYLLDPSCSLPLDTEHKARIDAELAVSSSPIDLSFKGCLITLYDIDVRKPGVYSFGANGNIETMAQFTDQGFQKKPIFYENDTIVADIDLNLGHHRIYAFGKIVAPTPINRYGVASAPYFVWPNVKYHRESFVVGTVRSVCFGILGIMCLFFLFINRQQNKVFLIYGLFILFNIGFIESSRSLIAEILGYRAGSYYFSFWGTVVLVVGSFCQFLMGIYFASFYEIKALNPRLYKVFKIFFTLILLAIPMNLLQLSFGPLYQTLVLAVASTLLISISLWFSFTRGGFYHLILIGYIIMICGALYFVLSTLGYMQLESLWARDIHLIGSTIEVTLFSIATSLKLNQQFAQQLALNAQLYANMEENVKERTLQLAEKSRDMRAILTNIKLGILTVKADLRIDSEYSRHAESIFHSDKLSDRPLLEVLFEGAQISNDLYDQIRSALEFSLQQDIVGFSANQGVLVHELTRLDKNGHTQYLELDWEPIVSDSEIVEKIIVTVRDVSEMRIMKETTEKNRRELDLLNQLLQVGSERFRNFSDNAKTILTKTQNLVTAMQVGAVEPLQEAFRYLHTIKGNARVLGLLELTELVHAAENSLDRLRSSLGNFEYDREECLATIVKLFAGFAAYQRVYQDRLLNFTKDPQHQGEHESLEQIRAKLADWHIRNPQIAQELQIILERNTKVPLKNLLEPLSANAAVLARELGKEIPKIHLQGGAILLDSQMESLLTNVFGHLFSNALNHGIEIPEKRLLSGKDPQGHIHIEALEQKHQLEFIFFDDGHGLNLDKVKSKAVDAKLIGAGESSADHDIALFIFRSGFSTAEQLTQSAGRGVGMDAIKAMILSVGGQLELKLDPDSPRQAKQFKLHLCVPKVFRHSPQGA